MSKFDKRATRKTEILQVKSTINLLIAKISINRNLQAAIYKQKRKKKKKRKFMNIKLNSNQDSSIDKCTTPMSIK